jgi:hypothetical protein
LASILFLIIVLLVIVIIVFVIHRWLFDLKALSYITNLRWK